MQIFGMQKVAANPSLHCVLHIIALQILAAIPCTQVCEEVVLQDAGELHQRVGVDPWARKDEIDVVAVATESLGQPRDLDPFLCHLFFDEIADMNCVLSHERRKLNYSGKNTIIVIRRLSPLLVLI